MSRLRAHADKRSESRVGAMLEMARLAQRLAVLLQAGLTPAAAWQHLGDSQLARAMPVAALRAGDIGTALDAAVSSLDANRKADAGEPAAAGSAIAICWVIATRAGSPLAPALLAIATGLRDAAATQRSIDVALAGPSATAKLVTVLPLVGVGFGAALGFDSIGVLTATPIGAVAALLGIALMLIARRWSNRLVTRARPASSIPGLAHELIAIALAGGLPPERAVELVVAEARSRGIPLDGLDAARDALELSARAGAPASMLLRSDAAERRLDRHAESQREAATLAVRLMLPMGACVLPAFMLLGVFPMLVTVVGSTLGAG